MVTPLAPGLVWSLLCDQGIGNLLPSNWIMRYSVSSQLFMHFVLDVSTGNSRRSLLHWY